MFVPASQNLRETLIVVKDVLTWTSAKNSIDHVEITPFAKMHRQVTTANVLRDTERDPMLKSHVNKQTLMFYVIVISTAQTTPSV